MWLGRFFSRKVIVFALLGALFIIWLIWGGKKRKTETPPSAAKNVVEQKISPEDNYLKSKLSPRTDVSEDNYLKSKLPQNVSPRTDVSEISSPPSLLWKKNNLPDHQHTNRRWKGEQLTCQTLEKIYAKPFVSARPSFLKNPETGRNLELDCYNEELKIGAEYQGVQHYVYPNPFHKNEEEFEKQRKRDDLKYDLCEREGVYLITIPYTVPQDKIPEVVWRMTPEVVSKLGYPDLSSYGARIDN